MNENPDSQHDALPSEAPEEEIVHTGHEPDAVNRPGLLMALGGLVLLIVFALLIIRGTIFLIAPEDHTLGTAAKDAQSAERFRGPRLTPDQPQQLQELRQTENQRLENYEWIDESAGTARIPIERAMEIIASEGLPAPRNSEDEDPNDDNAP